MDKTTDQGTAKRTGRPSKSEDGPKRQSFTARITDRTKAMLDEVAAATGRTAADVAADWLEDGYEGRAGLSALLGGSQVSDAIRAMIYHAHEVERRIGHPTEEPAAREALVAGWDAITKRAVPFIPASELEAEASESREDARAMMRQALARLDRQIEADPTVGESPPIVPLSLHRTGLFGGRAEKAGQQLSQFLQGVDRPSAAHVRDTLRSYVYGDSLHTWNHHDAIRVLRLWADEHGEPLFNAAADLLDAYTQALSKQLDASALAYTQGADMGDATARRMDLMPEIRRRAMILQAAD